VASHRKVIARDYCGKEAQQDGVPVRLARLKALGVKSTPGGGKSS